MLQTAGEPEKAEEYFWEARACLDNYPDIQRDFDALYLRDRPLSAFLADIHKLRSLKYGQKGSLVAGDLGNENLDVDKSNNVE
jgi:hypothetical protein